MRVKLAMLLFAGATIVAGCGNGMAVPFVNTAPSVTSSATPSATPVRPSPSASPSPSATPTMP